MEEKEIDIKIEGKSKNIFEVKNLCVLNETKTTRQIANFELHNKEVGGNNSVGIGIKIRYQKKSKNEEWENCDTFKLNTMKIGEEVAVEFGSNETEKLLKCAKVFYEDKDNLYNDLMSNPFPSKQYKIIRSNNNIIMIDDKNKLDVIKNLISQNYDSDFFNELKKIEPDKLKKQYLIDNIEEKEKIIKEFEERLNSSSGYQETAGNDSWQNFISTNNWMFGINYLKPIEKTKINISGSMPDFLFPTQDGFIDLLEIKLPTASLLSEDKSHTDSYYWHSDLNKAIAQVNTYLCGIEDNHLQIERQLKEKYNLEAQFIKPRVYILIGRKLINDKEKRMFKNLNSILHNIEIMTYDDLLNRAKTILNLIKEENKIIE